MGKELQTAVEVAVQKPVQPQNTAIQAQNGAQGASEAQQRYALISQASADPNCDPDKLRALLDIQSDWMKLDDERGYGEAMAATQAEAPDAIRDALNKATSSKYAKVETLNRTLKPHYTKHGLSVEFGEDDGAAEGFHRWTARCRFGLYYRDTFVDLPPDTAGIQGKVNKTLVHAMKSSGTYAQGILLSRIFNITIADHDVDGNTGEGVPIIDHAQHKQLLSMISGDEDKRRLLDWAGCEKTEDFPLAKFNVMLADPNYNPKGARKPATPANPSESNAEGELF